MFGSHKKAPRELKSLLTRNAASPDSPFEGDTIAERTKRRRRESRTVTKQDKSQNSFAVSEQLKAPKKSKLLKEKEAQGERGMVTEESGDEDMQEEKEELNAEATLLAMFKAENAAEGLTTTIDLKNLKSVSGSAAPFSDFVSQQIKMSHDQSQLVPVVKRDTLTGSERFFEDNAPQKRRLRIKKTLDDIASSYYENGSSFTEKHREELNELENSITRYFAQWEFQLNRNENILLHGFGFKEQLLEQYRAFHDNKNENIIWIHFHGNSDLSTLDSTYLMLLENLFGSQHVFSNLDLIRKAEHIRDYFKATTAKPIFKLIVHGIDGSLFENREARVALILLSDIPNVHLLATSENFNFFSVWNLTEGDKMNWRAHEVTSFRDYRLSMVNQKKIEKAYQNLKLEKSEVKSVLMTFNTHRREMFYILANHIVESKRRGHTNWNSINLNKFFSDCNESLICREQKNFHLYLEDYYRHRIFIPNKTRSGETRITIPMPLHDIRTMLLDKEIFGRL